MPVDFLIPCLKTYAWGKRGRNSLAHRLLHARSPEAHPIPSDETPGAELWFGDHPSGPSLVAGSNGTAFAACGDGGLAFLFKVLSVGKALSIQAHPDKRLAEALHEKFPDIYKDDNHKPEMAIAVSETGFEAMCMFRPAGQILAHIETVPELEEVVKAGAVGGAGLVDGSSVAGSNTDSIGNKRGIQERDAPNVIESLREAVAGGNAQEIKRALKGVYASLMCAPAEAVQRAVAVLVARLSAISPEMRSESEALAMRLDSQFPGGDVGVFSAFLLNKVNLAKGEALFLHANEPHAYLSGDCVEVMAKSDNVVRGGCTPKLKDVPTLVSMLTYNTVDAAAAKITPEIIAQGADVGGGVITKYPSPVEEFVVFSAVWPAGAPSGNARCSIPQGSIALVLEGEGDSGEGHKMHAGMSLFVRESAMQVVPGAAGMSLFWARPQY